MLSQLELEVVKQHKEWGFKAYLQWAYFDYHILQREITVGRLPEVKRLDVANKKMENKRLGFDYCYFVKLPEQEVNPLHVEQKAWQLLSPMVKAHVGTFNQYIRDYSPQYAEGTQLLVRINSGFGLLQKWNIIADSFGIKYDIAIYKGKPDFSHVRDEDWFKDVPEKENAVRALICELQLSQMDQ
jgi:hypothetical protein